MTKLLLASAALAVMIPASALADTITFGEANTGSTSNPPLSRIKMEETGNNIAFGFDPDHHFRNHGSKLTIDLVGGPVVVPDVGGVGGPVVPEPTTLALLATGLVGLGGYLRRRHGVKR